MPCFVIVTSSYGNRTSFVFNTTQHSGVSPWIAKKGIMQPNNGFGKDICIYAFLKDGLRAEHSWSDYDCTSPAWFLCKQA